MFGKKLAFGVNYWSSENADNMWRDFNADSIERDLISLKKAGVKWLRIFPDWSDFQPIKAVLKGERSETVYEDGTALDNTAEGVAGVSPVMAVRLEKVMDLCLKHGFRVELSLFNNTVPALLSNKNIFTDPLALMWEQKFIKYIVTRFKEHVALSCFSLGDDYSAIKNISTDIAAQYNWAMTMCNAIRVIDTTHPIVSGLGELASESTSSKKAQGWDIKAHCQCVDILTAHCFPAYRHSGERINTMRPIIRACGESNMYSDVGEKLCYTQKIGMDGYKSFSCDQENAFIRGNLLSAFLHGSSGLFLGNAFDKEESVGLLMGLGREKPVTKEAKRVMNIISQIDLPKHSKQAVCVIPSNVVNPARLSANVMCLATQNDLGVHYRLGGQTLPDSQLYIVPFISEGFTLNEAEQLKEKARRGATVYASVSDVNPQLLNELIGPATVYRTPVSSPLSVIIDSAEIRVKPPFMYRISDANVKVLASFSDGSPAIVCAYFGNGKIIVSLFSVEAQVAGVKDAFYNDTYNYHKVYSLVSKIAGVKKDFYTENIYVGTLEHKIDAKRSIISLMNYSDTVQEYTVGSSVGYNVKKVLYGSLDGKLSNNDGVIFEIEKY